MHNFALKISAVKDIWFVSVKRFNTLYDYGDYCGAETDKSQRINFIFRQNIPSLTIMEDTTALLGISENKEHLSLGS